MYNYPMQKWHHWLNTYHTYRQESYLMYARTCWDVLALPTHDLRLIPLARVATSYVEMSSVAPGEAYFIS